MLFNSDIFLFAFLPLAVLGYYLLAHRQGVWSAKVWLCAASFVFYGWWNPAFLLLLTGSIAFNYLVSQQLTGTEERSGRQNVILTFGVVANLLLLFYYKYLFPLLGFLHHAGVTEADYGSVILPIGISFFTFTQIGYLVDCRQGLVRERGLLNYVLFVTFFPHLIAGPILHHKEIMPQFANEASYRFRADNLSIGLTVFALGLVKKVMLADSIAPWAEAGFDHPQGWHSSSPGRWRSPIRCSCISTSPATPTWPSVLASCSASGCRSISTRLTSRRRSSSSGSGGT
ncbi:MAG: MBOAT family O-acyltransferase [Gammaproteobacteria bacterium]